MATRSAAQREAVVGADDIAVTSGFVALAWRGAFLTQFRRAGLEIPVAMCASLSARVLNASASAQGPPSLKRTSATHVVRLPSRIASDCAGARSYRAVEAKLELHVIARLAQLGLGDLERRPVRRHLSRRAAGRSQPRNRQGSEQERSQTR